MKNKKLIIITVIISIALAFLIIFNIDKEENPHKLYNEVLTSLLGNTDYSQYNFALTHIDNDDILELIVIDGNSIKSGADVYSIYDNKVFYVGTFGSQGTIRYAYKDSLIDSAIYDSGFYCNSFYKLSKGTVELENDISASSDLTYTINNKEVSEQEYKQLNQSYQKDKTWIEVSFNDLVHLNVSTLEAFKDDYTLFEISK